MHVVKPPSDFRSVDANYQYAIFLAGSIEMGKADLWQERIARRFEDLPILILDPRRNDWDPTWPQDPTPGTEFYKQVEWEQDAIAHADTHIFYFDENTKSPITLMELGSVLTHKDFEHVYVRCTPKFWRYGNVKFMCDRYNVPVFDHEIDGEDEMITAIRSDFGW